MDILGNFGFDYKLFIGQLVNFLILVYVFKRFLYKPILNVLKEREERIKSGLENAEKTKAILEQTDRQREDILRATRAEAQGIIDNTRKIAEDLRQDILDKSRAESEKMLARAKEQAAAEMKKMEKDIKVMSLDLSQKILLTTIQTLFTDEEKQRVMKKALEKIQQGESR